MVTLLLTATGLFPAKSRSISRPWQRSRKSPACRHDVIAERSSEAAADVMRLTLRSRLLRLPTADAGAELQVKHIHATEVNVNSKFIQCNSGFVQTLKHCFPGLFRTCNLDQIPGFSRTQKTRFQGLSRIHTIHKHGCMRSKSTHTKSVFHVIALQ